MKFISIAMAFALVAGTAAVAQDAPKADLFLGYSGLRANPARNIPSFINNGGLGTFAWNFNPHIAWEFEFGGYHNGNINNFEFDTTEMTYLFGPRFSLSRSKRFIPYIHTLFGGVHLTTSIPVTVVAAPTSTTTGTTTRIGASQDTFAMALGGGLDIKLSHSVMLRPMQWDYVLTRLEDFGQSGTPSQNRNQNNVRFAAGLVFTFGGERPSPPTTTALTLPTPPRTKQCAGGNEVPIDQDCPKQNARLGIQANPSQLCPGTSSSVAASGALPPGATFQWSINGEPVSQAPRLDFGATGRAAGAYNIRLKVTARDYNDAIVDTAITVLGYTPPSGSVSVSPSEIWLGDKATLTASFTPGQCGGPVTVTYSATEGSISGNQFDSTNVRLAPPASSEQRRTITLMAKASDAGGSGAAQTSVVVKQRAALAARQLPDVLFAQGSDRVNNCGKRVLLEELRRLTDSDPQGRVVIVGHLEGTESASQSLDMKRALNAAAVISAGQGVCTSFPASQILVNAVGGAENGVAYQPNFCAGSTAVAERPGQTVVSSDDAAKSRRVEVWFVPAGGTLPPSAANAKGAATLGVGSLGCPQ